MQDFRDKSIFVAGHRGMVGSAIVRKLGDIGCSKLLLKTHAELDLLDQVAVRNFMQEKKPDIVILAAAKVGGISANNTYRAEFIYDNIMIESNIIHASYVYKLKKLLLHK
jgi:GDP-L-fucose synthase